MLDIAAPVISAVPQAEAHLNVEDAYWKTPKHVCINCSQCFMYVQVVEWIMLALNVCHLSRPGV